MHLTCEGADSSGSTNAYQMAGGSLTLSEILTKRLKPSEDFRSSLLEMFWQKSLAFVLDSTSNAYKERKIATTATSRLISTLFSLWRTLGSDAQRDLGAHHQWHQWHCGSWHWAWEGTFAEAQPGCCCASWCSMYILCWLLQGFPGKARDFSDLTVLRAICLEGRDTERSTSRLIFPSYLSTDDKEVRCLA